MKLRNQIFIAGSFIILSSTALFWFVFRPGIVQTLTSERMTIITQLHQNFISQNEHWFQSALTCTDVLMNQLNENPGNYEETFRFAIDLYPELIGQDVISTKFDDVLEIRNSRFPASWSNPASLTYFPLGNGKEAAWISSNDLRLFIIKSSGIAGSFPVTAYTAFNFSGFAQSFSGYQSGTGHSVFISDLSEVYFSTGNVPDTLLFKSVPEKLTTVIPEKIDTGMVYVIRGQFESVPYRLTTVLPEVAIAGPVNQFMNWFLIIILFFTIIFLAGVEIFSRAFIRPVNQLLQSIRPISNYDFSSPVAPVNVPELLPVSQSLETMRASLYEYDVLKTRQLILAESRNQFMINYINDLLVFGDETGAFKFMNNRLSDWLNEIPETDRPQTIIHLIELLKKTEVREPVLAEHQDSDYLISMYQSESKIQISAQHSPDVYKVQFITIFDYLSGKTLGYLLLLHDLTEDRVVEETKRDMMNIMVHELRNPLASIMGFTDLMIEDGDVNPDNKSYLEIIKKSSQKLTDLVTRFLDIQRLESGRVELDISPANIVYVTEDILARFGPQLAEKNLTVKFVKPETVTLVPCDFMLVGDAIQNLLSNAIKYGDPGREILIEFSSDHNNAIFRITDFGFGISAADQVRLFTKFYRVKSNKKSSAQVGTGLGLAYVKEIINRHRGQISLESNDTIGCRFTIQLPLRQEVLT